MIHAEEFLRWTQNQDRAALQKTIRQEADLSDWQQIILKGDAYCRSWVARNKTIPEKIMEDLSKDPVQFVRIAIACHPKLTAPLFYQLANDSDYVVKSMVLQNRHTPADIILHMMSDSNQSISKKATEMAAEMKQKAMYDSKPDDRFESWQLSYSDAYGTDQTVTQSCGRYFSFVLRGHSFSGENFQLANIDAHNRGTLQLEGNQADTNAFHQIFDGTFEVNQYGDLLGVFSLQMTLAVRERKEVTLCPFRLIADEQKQSWQGILVFKEKQYSSEAESAELLLCKIERLLPKSASLHCCLACKYAHYHPYGGGSEFGQLRCFRDWPGKKRIVDKPSLFREWSLSERTFKSSFVQKTWCCSKFKPASKKDFNYNGWQYHQNLKAKQAKENGL